MEMTFAGLAHLVEQRYRKPQVAGSSPAAGSKQLNSDAPQRGRSPDQSVGAGRAMVS